jgi:hypothetical protein
VLERQVDWFIGEPPTFSQVRPYCAVPPSLLEYVPSLCSGDSILNGPSRRSYGVFLHRFSVRGIALISATPHHLFFHIFTLDTSDTSGTFDTFSVPL